MRVLQTIGSAPGRKPSPFYFRRDHEGVHFESVMDSDPITETFSHDEWQELLVAIQGGPERLQVSSTANDDENVRRLHSIIGEILGPKGSRCKKFISAVLVNDGTLIIDHGLREGGHAAVFLRRP